jgi:carboxymethylenebutenolidase
MRSTLAPLAALVVLLAAGAPAFAEGKVKATMITFKSGDEEAQGYLAEPEGDGPFPAVVVIQEWWGLTDWVKENARRFAARGYVALAPDLYRGKVATDPRMARQLMMGLPRDRALRDLKAAVDALAARPNVDKAKVGSIGWCMGGGYSLQLALHDPRVTACAMCYGQVVPDAAKLKDLNATVLGVFGEEDRGIPPKQVHEFEEALKEAGKKVDKIREFKAGHGFMRPQNAPGADNPEYRAEEAKAAWRDIDQFFAKTLKGKG